MSRIPIRVVVSCALAIALVLTLGSCGGGKKTAPLTPGTTTVDIPPLPEYLATLAYSADAMIGRDCADVPSGLNNCKAWLREEAGRQLLGLLERHYEEQLISDEKFWSAGSNEAGAMEEDREVAVKLVRDTVASARIDSKESPVLSMPDGKNLAMRVLVIQDMADYVIWTEIAENAAKDGRTAIAGRYKALLRDRFGDDPPTQKNVEEAERGIARHLRELWDMAQKNAEGA